ncbi:MAG: hypothetical protein B9S32_05870 [Verrucomicrobia bacterium Tous-C9LFEB]|nr:MAG: hypothetical protein B9S32_05870 [Verrucomicrobia bacterium Tous-C9LFEB]
MMKLSYRWVGLIVWWSASGFAFANVSLPPFFSDHAVLQKAAKVPIWGKADPGEKVTVAVGDAKAEAVADAQGKWRVNLDLHDKAYGPYELVAEGKNRVVATDVVVGEVWLCSGQSNMEFTLKQADNAAQEIPASANPLLRHFHAKYVATSTPQETTEGKWELASPQTSGGFTAVGYFFGKKLQQTLNVPVGLLHTSWGATPVEAWTSVDSLSTVPDLKETTDKLLKDEATLPQRQQDYLAQYAAWEKKYNREDKPAPIAAFVAPTIDVNEWKKVTLPGDLAAAGVPDHGAIWVRRTVTVPPELSNRDWALDLAIIHDFDEVYWNGEKRGATTPQTPGANDHRLYYVPGPLVKAGDNVLAIRIFAPKGGAGISNSSAGFHGLFVSFAGEWLAKVEKELSPLDAEGKATYPVQPTKLPNPQKMPGHLFNGMIHPFIPYAIRGVIWYQGEGNAGRAYQYRTSMPLLVKDWRRQWGAGDFPFYLCQLASYGNKKKEPGESDMAELREAQTLTTLTVPNTGEAVLVDIGEDADIHPRNKKDAGERLAFVALSQTYGQNVPFSGPLYQSMVVEGDKVRISFKHVEGGLVAKPLPDRYQPTTLHPQTVPLVRNSPQSELEGFAICGEDQKWKWAEATIQGDTVIVSSPDVPKPVAVRYAWANSPLCNLTNRAGLPAVPFRTDDFPPITLNRKF